MNHLGCRKVGGIGKGGEAPFLGCRRWKEHKRGAGEYSPL